MDFCDGILCNERLSDIMTLEGKCTQPEIIVLTDKRGSRRKHYTSFLIRRI